MSDKTTIRDVARLAKVSYATVSNVINNKGRMSEGTKKRVLHAVNKLNFYPDTTAAALSRGKADAIAFVSSYLSSPFVTGILSGAESRLYETGKISHDIVHYATKGMDISKTTVIEDILYGKKACGVILLTMNIKPKLTAEFRKRGIPLVLVESRMKGVHSVRADNVGGAYDAVSYLIQKGRKNIAIVTGPLEPSVTDMDVSPAEHERLEGYKKALSDAGMAYNEKNLIQIPFYNPEEGEKCMIKLAGELPKTDAVFCAAGDLAAAGMIKQARKLGIKVPSDMAFIGYDDIPAASVSRPSITTIRQPLYEMGRAAFDIVLDSIGRKNAKPSEMILRSELIARESA